MQKKEQDTWRRAKGRKGKVQGARLRIRRQEHIFPVIN
jgi:hypothetical protein